jgi:glutamate-1-semialdehyde 2,1-aminomutase
MTDESAERERRVLARIPGGAQLLSKRPEQFAPGQWPRHYSRAKGAHTWDLDGRPYVDMSTSGIGTCVLGFADADVDAAVKRVIDNGSMSTLNCVEELELADLLCELHPWADMVRYARSGGEALAIAVRLARAATGRATVAFCGYHGWHDWYLAANLAAPGSLDGHLLPGLDPGGVPAQLAGTAFGFRYNRLDELAAIAAEHRLAAIMMEPVRDRDPAPGFLEGVAELARKTGAVLIFDEVTSGLRVNTGGIHLALGVEPDVAVFAKAIGNGYPMAAVLGRASVMEHAQRSFISSTYWTERIGPTAALATIRKHRANSVGDRLVKVGSAVQEGWRAAAAASGLEVSIQGIAPLSHLRIVEQPQPSITLFTQLMLDRGFLAGGSFYPSFAHSDEQIEAYLVAVEESFPAIRAAQESGPVQATLRGPVAHTGFTRLT